MTNSLENSPLHVGDAALRFRIEWRGAPARPVVVGVRAVWVVAVSADGSRVTWTEGRKRRDGGEHRQTCDRRELLSVAALETLSPTNAPLPELAASAFNPAAAA